MRKKINILFIYISFFGYEKEIINTLSKIGYRVHFFDERISNLKVFKAAYRSIPILRLFLSNIHFFNILRKVKSLDRFDYLFVLKGEVTPSWFVKRIKFLFPNIKTIYYSWDSFKNNPNGLKLIELMEKKISFDFHDSIKYKLYHRPLFSSLTRNYGDLIINQNLAASVFTIHSDRVSVLSRIISQLKIHGVETKYYAYSRFEQFDKIKSAVSSDEEIKLQNKPLAKNDLNMFLSDANFIIDINHPEQTGLTMRTFEALVLSKKLISTNSNLKNYVFYNENNICVVDRNNIVIPDQFINSKFENYDNEFTELMTIEGWLKEIFSDSTMFKWTV